MRSLTDQDVYATAIRFLSYLARSLLRARRDR
jgi:hypothetical protein